jgi:dolichyl-phosphate-mannose--protein O-mannosyl transferase
VKYEDVVKNGQKLLYIGNIYTMGHPLIWWAGLLGVIYALGRWVWGVWQRIAGTVSKDKNEIFAFSLILAGYFGMFLPWVASPRIMFLYHYLPSVPFLCLALSYGLCSVKKIRPSGTYVVTGYLILVILLFIYFYPQWSALPLPQNWVDKYYWLPSWK